MTPAEQLKAARACGRLSQAKAAECIGVPLRTYQNWEIGHRLPPDYVLQLALERLEAART